MVDVWSMLQSRRRTSPGAPVVTYVDVERGERTELSAATTENLAAKIANALQQEFGLSEGDTVGLHLPVHWQRSAWCAGVWTAGCVVAPGAVDASLIVAGPEQAATLAGTDVLVVSLHPFGLPVDAPLPSGAEDVTLVVRQQPDAFLGTPPGPRSPALRVDRTELDQSGVLAAARELGTRWGLADGGRLLADDAIAGGPADSAQEWLAALAVPLACSASVLLVRGDGSGLVDAERVTARAVR